MYIIIFSWPGLLLAILCLCFSFAIGSFFPHLTEFQKGLTATLPLTVFGYVLALLDVRAHIYYIPVYIYGAIGLLLIVGEAYGPIGVAAVIVATAIAFVAVRVIGENKRWRGATASLERYRSLGPNDVDLREHHLLQALFQNNWLRGTQAKVQHNRAAIEHMLGDGQLNLTQQERQALQTVRASMESGKTAWLGWRLRHISALQKQLDYFRQQRGIGKMLF